MSIWDYYYYDDTPEIDWARLEADLEAVAGEAWNALAEANGWYYRGPNMETLNVAT